MPHNIEEIWSRAKPIGPIGPIGWPIPDLSIINDGRREPPPLPVETFGPWQEWIEQSAESKLVPVDYVAAGLLACAASLLGNRRWGSPWPGWKEPSALWMMLVGDPSAGKSPAMDCPLNRLHSLEDELALDFPDTLRRYERDKEAAELARQTWKAEVKAAADNDVLAPVMPETATEPERPVRPQLIMSDATTEEMVAMLAAHPEGLLCCRDELAGLFGSFNRYGGGGDREFWTECYGGRPYTKNRVKHHGVPTRAPYLTVGVLGGIQPEKLAATLLKSEDDGLLARFLTVWPNKLAPGRPRVIPDDRAAGAALRRILSLEMQVTEDGRFVPVVVAFSSGAEDLFEKWQKSNHHESHGVAGLYLSHLGKLPGVAVRLASTLEYLRWAWSGAAGEPSEISLETVGHALDLIDEYFKPQAERVYGDAALPQSERDATIIARAILERKLDAFNARDARKDGTFRTLKDATRVDNAIKVLVEAGWVRETAAREGDTKGRQRKDYEVNPAVHGGR